MVLIKGDEGGLGILIDIRQIRTLFLGTNTTPSLPVEDIGSGRSFFSLPTIAKDKIHRKWHSDALQPLERPLAVCLSITDI